MMNSQQQKEFLQATAWLRPLTRWAAALSIRSVGILPAWFRNLPLKIVKRILAHDQARMTSNCKSRKRKNGQPFSAAD
ncbi:hypothetical protein B9Z51_10310 [Limnohabitans sp. T6-5]|nr:hypothetical protein B9Z51_10310 [Limnohabitans sp. T6-5]